MSPKVRLLALGGLVAAFALGGGLLVLSKHQSSSSAALPKIHPLYAHKRHHARPHKAPIHAASHQTAKHKPKHRAPAVVDGMPAALAVALESHQVVVVSLYARDSHVDELAHAEAAAGARDAGAGFVSIDVLNERQSHAMTQVLATAPSASDRLLDDPAVLVFQQPKTLFVRLNGFVDRDTVAQAAQNAIPLTATAAPAPQVLGTWAESADAVCTRMQGQVLSLVSAPVTVSDPSALLDQILGVANTGVANLRSLPVPAGKARQISTMLAAYDEMLKDARTAVAAAKRHDRPGVESAVKDLRSSAARGERILHALGATQCAPH